LAPQNVAISFSITVIISFYPNGCGEHTDFGCFSLLSQANVNGLQIKNANGEWIDAKPIENTIVVNIADIMQRWTNDTFMSTVHRVINRNDQDRYSLAFFFNPDYFTKIECLPEFCDSERSAKYGPVLAGEYILDRTKKTTKPDY
jgi:isopenicillin N synthase-like dioxygenase